MFEKFRSIFTRKNKKRRPTTHIKKRHYSLGDMKKPSFKKRKKSFSPSFLLKILPSLGGNIKFLLMIACLLFLIVSGLFVLYSPYFKLSEIDIYRQDSVINIDQAYGNVDYLRDKNILFLDTSEIAQRLQKSQKSISNIEFDIDFPNRINIHLGSHPMLFQTQEHLILSNGIVVSKDGKKYVDVPFLQTSQDIQDYAIFGNTLNVQNLKNLDSLVREIKKNILGFDFQHIKYFIREKEILIAHSSGSIFIFDLGSDSIASQVEKLAVYDKEKGSIYEKKYVYIDVRIPEKLFLCSLETEFTCKQNIKNIYGETIFEEFSKESSELQQGDLPDQNL